MGITDIPILSMLRTRLDWSQARQRILADNVANADTPHFRGRDLARQRDRFGRRFDPGALAAGVAFDHYR